MCAVDWAAVEAAYRDHRNRLESAGHPDVWKSETAGGVWVFDARPEFGLGVHVLDQQVADTLKRAGIRFIRITLYWHSIENTATPGKYDTTALKRWSDTVELCRQNRLIPVVVVHGNAPGCSFDTRRYSWRRYARFMADMASRYPYIRYWELWNEMDVAFTDLFGAGVTPEIPMEARGRLYVEMLRLAYPAIKRANPRAIVLTGGIVDHERFPLGMYAAGGREFFDIMNIHTYGIPLQWAFVERGARLREIMTEYGDASKPLWNTEFGVDAGSIVRAWGIPQPADSAAAVFDQHQEEMILDCLAFQKRSGLYHRCFAYQYAAGNEAETERLRAALPTIDPDDYGFGFTRADGRTPRPVLQRIMTKQPNRDAQQPAQRKIRLSGSKGNRTVTVRSDYPIQIAAEGA